MEVEVCYECVIKSLLICSQDISGVVRADLICTASDSGNYKNHYYKALPPDMYIDYILLSQLFDESDRDTSRIESCGQIESTISRLATCSQCLYHQRVPNILLTRY
jgi:hypothetical protein